ncbi:MAG: helix-turn-helix domain-containing protein [Actinomycetota bacterium]|nr:helix-turn-helix domain-containing protein [Actinomycetota bacterium]
MTGTWPWPGDTATERARRIANSLLALVQDDRERSAWIGRAHAVGETWLGGDLLRWGTDDVISTEEAARLLHVGPSCIRKWHSDGHLPNVSRGRYRVGDVLDAAAEMRRRRAARRIVGIPALPVRSSA